MGKALGLPSSSIDSYELTETSSTGSALATPASAPSIPPTAHTRYAALAPATTKLTKTAKGCSGTGISQTYILDLLFPEPIAPTSFRKRLAVSRKRFTATATVVISPTLASFQTFVYGFVMAERLTIGGYAVPPAGSKPAEGRRMPIGRDPHSKRGKTCPVKSYVPATTVFAEKAEELSDLTVLRPQAL